MLLGSLRTDSTSKIPFKDFVLTNAGELVPHQVQMYRERVRTVGISLLGGNSGVEGPYELGIDSIQAVNVEDVTDTSALGEWDINVDILRVSLVVQRRPRQKGHDGRGHRCCSRVFD